MVLLVLFIVGKSAVAKYNQCVCGCICICVCVGGDGAGLRAGQHPKVIEYEKQQTLPDVDDVKPASNQADFKSVAAMVVLRVASVSNFVDAGGFWVTRLMDAHNIYLEKMTGTYFISFGVHGDAGMSWEVTPFGDGNAFSALQLCQRPPTKRPLCACSFFARATCGTLGRGTMRRSTQGFPLESVSWICVCVPFEAPVVC